MKRWELMSAAIGLVLVAAGILAILGDDLNLTVKTLEAGGFHVPVTRFEAREDVVGSAVVIHGLAANRALMTTLCRSLARGGVDVYAIDLSGHGDNTDPFTYANAELSAIAVIRKLATEDPFRLDSDLAAIFPERTVIIGHSLGGDIVLRMADSLPDFPAAATIAISPGPLTGLPEAFEKLRVYPMPERLPRNLLQLVGSVDMPLFALGAEALHAKGGGTRQAPDDFRAGRALRLSTIPWATHTSLIMSESAMHEVMNWTRMAWGQPFSPPRWRFVFPLRQGLVIGVVLLFPAAARLAGSLGKRKAQSASTTALEITATRLWVWALAAVLSVLVLRFLLPLDFLHLTTGAYVASVLLLTAIFSSVFSAGVRRAVWESMAGLRRAPAALAGALLIGCGLLLAFGAAVDGEYGDLWMNQVRWWRFAILVPLLWPYFAAEQSLIGPATNGNVKSVARRWGWFFLLRAILWLAMFAGLALLDSKEILVVVMAFAFTAFSVAQLLAADAVERRFSTPGAASVLSAILAAWFLAAVFPLS